MRHYSNLSWKQRQWRVEVRKQISMMFKWGSEVEDNVTYIPITHSLLLSDNNGNTTVQNIEVQMSELSCHNKESGNKI